MEWAEVLNYIIGVELFYHPRKKIQKMGGIYRVYMYIFREENNNIFPIIYFGMCWLLSLELISNTAFPALSPTLLLLVV